MFILSHCHIKYVFILFIRFFFFGRHDNFIAVSITVMLILMIKLLDFNNEDYGCTMWFILFPVS